MSKSGGSSQIKGGGRATLSEEAEEEVVSLLLSLRRTSQSSSKTGSAAGGHNRKHEHKRFVRQLVERHERRQLAKKVNRVDIEDGPNSSGRASKSKQQVHAAEDQPLPSKGNEKVRIELVEAVVDSQNKSSAKTKKSSSKPTSVSTMKSGTRKTIVFARSTPVEDVMEQAKGKLRMKKKPVRCFVVEKKIEMDLMGDLRGLPDGAVVYVTCQEREEKETAYNDSNEAVENEVCNDESEDVLDALKQAYIERNQKARRKQFCAVKKLYAEHPSFSSCFHKLPSLPPNRSQLPAAACRERILEAVERSRVTIIRGATGCGKSTQIPQYLFEGMLAAAGGDMTQILVTQPRRVAAMSLAQRVAFEMQSPNPGTKNSLVGYNVRLDRSVSDTAKIVYCTVGILLRMLTNPSFQASTLENNDSNDIPLSHYSHILLDEVHERDLNTDFCLTLIRSVLSVNKHIRIILMSATAASDVFLKYFTGVDGVAPRIIDIPGRSFPVDIKWLDDCQRFASATAEVHVDARSDSKGNKKLRSGLLLSPRAEVKIDNIFICKLIYKVAQPDVGSNKTSNKDRETGAILVFLPGKAEIESLARALQSDFYPGNSKFCRVLRLHSSIPRHEQKTVFEPVKEGYVKIVLATNVAETSITLPDVTHVIDTGRVKESRFNTSTRIKELVTVWTSQASAKQRAGRAGRVSAGVCWRLYTEHFFTTSLLEYTSPEILRTPLDELVLQVCLLYEHKNRPAAASDGLFSGVCPVRFLSKAPEPPSSQNVVDACEHLLEVGAIDVVSHDPVLYRLTPLGYHLSRLPMDAKVGKVLIVGCMLECVDPSLTIAASFSCTKSCFLSWSGACNETWKMALEKRKFLVETGFGGRNWRGGTVKGDSMAAIAAYNEWRTQDDKNKRAAFCKSNALDNTALAEIHQLRNHFWECLLDSGFLSREGDYNKAEDNALLTSCCLVAGLYPNVATLVRPQKDLKRLRHGRLLTKDGDACRPCHGSFQSSRVDKASADGKDAYAVYHAKHRSVGVRANNNAATDVLLREVNFVSRFALLLFGGQLTIRNNAIIVDGWLKFKVGSKGLAGALLIQELRTELDKVFLRHMKNTASPPNDRRGGHYDGHSQQVLDVVKKLLSTD